MTLFTGDELYDDEMTTGPNLVILGLLLDDPCPVCGAQADQQCDPDSSLCWGGAR